MLERDEENEKLFDKFTKDFYVTRHYEDCLRKGSSEPINECQCWCYEMQIFKLGRDAQEQNDDKS
jgi:hypothetical protein